MIVYKRDGRAVVYDENKIIKAIQKVNKEVEDLQERATMLEIKSLLSVIESTYRSKTTKDKEGITLLKNTFYIDIKEKSLKSLIPQMNLFFL